MMKLCDSDTGAAVAVRKTGGGNCEEWLGVARDGLHLQHPNNPVAAIRTKARQFVFMTFGPL
jgi:hypothetical protein